METACGYFGLHPWELPWDTERDNPERTRFQKQIRAHLTSLVAQQNISRFIVSVDGGAALLVAEAILEMKAQHPVTLECVIPFEELPVHWSEAERERYFSVLERCDVENMINRSFTLNCYRRCAQYLAEQCGTLLILWNEKPGDAGDAIAVAHRFGRRLILLSPTAFSDKVE